VKSLKNGWGGVGCKAREGEGGPTAKAGCRTTSLFTFTAQTI